MPTSLINLSNWFNSLDSATITIINIFSTLATSHDPYAYTIVKSYQHIQSFNLDKHSISKIYYVKK